MRGTWITLAAVLLAACAEEREATEGSRHEIAGGTRETGEPAVALVKVLGVVGLCTGTLITERVVLTAKHCVQAPRAGGPYPAAFLTIGFGSSIDATDDWRAQQIFTTPGMYTSDPATGIGGDLVGQDIAAIVLRPREGGVLPDIAPLPIRRDDPRDRVGLPFTAIGFGQTPTGGSGTKFRTTGTVDTISGGVIYSSMTICSGDSGGPMIQEEPERRVFGVASFGERDACPSRLDGHNRIDLLLGVVDRAILGSGGCPEPGLAESCNSIDDDCDRSVDEGCALPGEPCTESSDCAFAQLPERFEPLATPAVCEETPAGRICTRRCDALRPHDACASIEVPFVGTELPVDGSYCASVDGCEGRCLPGGPGALAIDAPCAADTDCASLACLDPGDGRRRCRSRCVGDAGHCPDLEVCVAAAGACGACVPPALFLSPRGIGEPCAAGADCASGSCFADGAVSYCSRACTAHTECPDGFHCRGSACARGEPGDIGDPCLETGDCFTGMVCVRPGTAAGYCGRDCSSIECPERFTCGTGDPPLCDPSGALGGEACAADGDCQTGVCAEVAGARVCAERCALATDCASGFECRRGDEGLGGLCVDPTTRSGGGGGGCAAAGPGPDQAWFLAMFLLLFRRARRIR